MIHYHGTPVGGPRQDAVRFLTGRHALVSFAHPDDLPIVADVCQSFVLDNGAFTTWKQGRQMDWQGYIKWVEAWFRHPGFDWALIPDVIDGDEEQNDDLLEQWPTHLAGVPVWHMHESVYRLERLAKLFKIVALGSSGEYASVGTMSWWMRMSKAMEAICDDQGRPMCKLHGLRMLNPEVFSRLPLSSADSTNAAVNSGSLSRFGMYLPPTVSQRAAVIAERIEAHNSAPIFVKRDQQELTLI